jgi:uncharacterized protein (TIGR02117 family)
MSSHRWNGAGVFLLVASLLGACSGAIPQQNHRNEENVTEKFFVVHDDWHSAIVVSTADLSADVLPEIGDFPGAEYLEFSWGDRDYFPHPAPGVGLALKAALWSSGSIIHVVGLRGTPADSYPNAEIITIALPPARFHRLMQFVSDTFSRSHPKIPGEALPGLSPNARFYLAQGKFSIFRTCNTWVAEALQAAELPITPTWVITAGSLGRHARPLGIPQ